jgi:hypothetical protein
LGEIEEWQARSRIRIQHLHQLPPEVYHRQALSADPENPFRINDLAYFLIDRDLNVEEGLMTICINTYLKIRKVMPPIQNRSRRNDPRAGKLSVIDLLSPFLDGVKISNN